jgi:hypothetical protein
VEGSRGRGKLKLRWMNVVVKKGLNIGDVYVHDCDRWRRVVHSKHIWAG